MNQHKIKISIVVTLYNCEKYISSTIESIYNQTFTDYEVIIVNDCSLDNGPLIVADFIKGKPNWSLYNNEVNVGVAASRNLGFELAQGKYIAILDSDDIWFDEKLEKQYSYMESENLDLCYSSYIYFIDDIQKPLFTYEANKEVSYKSLLKENYIGCSTVVLKKEITNLLKMPLNAQHEDYAYWLSILKRHYLCRGLIEPLVYYRYINTSRSYNKRSALKGRFAIYYTIEKLGLFRSLFYFAIYAINSIKKYRKLI